MPRVYYLFLCVFFFQNALVFAQGKVITRHRYYGLKIEEFRNRKESPIHKIDSIGYSIVNGDTIIKISRKEKNPGEWVRVPYEPKDSSFLFTYKRIVFNKRGPFGDPKARMRYWKKPINIFFDPSVANKSKRKLSKFAQKLDKDVDSLSIDFVKNPEEANYFIYFQDKSSSPLVTEEKLNDRYVGFQIYWNGAQQFKRCYLKLNPSVYPDIEEQVQLLRKNFFQTLGYFFLQKDLSCSSYFSSCFNKNDYLTQKDLELLRYHYSYGICKGTDLEEFEKQHQRAKEILNRGPNSSMGFMHKVK